MFTQVLLLGFVLSTLYGAVFHLWRGGGASRLLLYLVLSWAGFWAGQFLASLLGWEFDKLGQLHIAIATLGSLLFLFAGSWIFDLSRLEN